MKPSYVKAFVILVLLLSFIKMPFGYYQFLRITTCIGSLIIAYDYYKKKKDIWIILFGAIAVLFNPIIVIHFKRDIWQVFDGITILIFVVSLVVELRFKKL